ncbi:MAG: IclR family transcriptional regulator domain-containing protein [Janthinobacterium lividum]
MSGTRLLGKAFDVLDAVGAAPGGLNQAEIAARLGLPRTTLYRILAALVERGLLRQDPSRRVYAVGFRLLEIAQGAWSAPDLPVAAAPELRALRDTTGETAYIAVLEGREVVALGKFEGAHEVRSAARLGQRKPLHCTSQGKAILAFLPPEERAALLRRLPLPALTRHTITDRRRLLAALELVRARGFAVDDEEIAEGVRCVGAPVLDRAGRVLGAVSVAGPAWRMTLERVELLGAEVAMAGRRVGAQFRPPAAAQAGLHAWPGPAAFRGVGPCWSRHGDCLWWADALAPEVRCAAADGTPRLAVRWDTLILALVLAGDGVLVVDALGTATRLDAMGVVTARHAVPALRELQALCVHPDGTAWASLPAVEGGSALCRLDAALVPGGPVWRLPGGVQSLCWSGDGGALFAASPDAGTVHQLVPGRSAPLLLSRLPAGGGRPAALAVDAEGRAWAALRDGWSVARLTADGDVERVFPLPVPRPTGLAFGGPGLATLFVVTGRDGMGSEMLAAAPLAGAVLALEAGVRGAAMTACLVPPCGTNPPT